MLGFERASHSYAKGTRAISLAPAAQHGSRAAWSLFAARAHFEIKRVLNRPSFAYLMLGASFLSLALLVLIFAACPVEDVALPLCVTLGGAGTYLIPCHSMPVF